MPRLAEALSPGRHGRRYLLAALAWVVLVTQGVGFAHFLLVRHAVCPEHGELVHASEVSEAARVDSAIEARSTRVAVQSGDDPAHEHAHCQVATHRRQGAIVPEAEVTVAIAPAAATTPFPFVSVRRSTADALYGLAPKTSPPV